MPFYDGELKKNCSKIVDTLIIAQMSFDIALCRRIIVHINDINRLLCASNVKMNEHILTHGIITTQLAHLQIMFCKPSHYQTRQK